MLHSPVSLYGSGIFNSVVIGDLYFYKLLHVLGPATEGVVAPQGRRRGEKQERGAGCDGDYHEGDMQGWAYK